MEKSLSLLERIKQEFALKEVDIRTYSPLTLAYIGDGIYDLIVRTVVVERGNESANRLHRKTIGYVNAKTQAQMMEALLPDLTEEEVTVFKRGRNAKSYTSAKNASIADYRKATGFEALLGYLYLQDKEERILELVKIGLEKMNLQL
ncbi:MAG: ribonuclease III [Lachnospiraceae bacterium]|nr:ribonuclease III [Lachnospiraceae bacterium]